MLSKTSEKAAKGYIRNTPTRDLCLACVTSGDVRPGPYNLLPILGSLHKNRDRTFLLMTVFLLHIADDRHVGVMNWLLPLGPEMDLVIARLLAGFGWDGRVWPQQDGWPGAGKEASGLKALMQGQELLATMTFPPTEDGSNAIVRRDILRSSADFALSPELEGVEPTEVVISRMRELALDPLNVFGEGKFPGQ